jgi:hypothetical protein
LVLRSEAALKMLAWQKIGLGTSPATSETKKPVREGGAVQNRESKINSTHRHDVMSFSDRVTLIFLV